MQIDQETLESVEAALAALLSCPAIADGDLNSDVWGCPESAAADAKARAALARLRKAMEAKDE